MFPGEGGNRDDPWPIRCMAICGASRRFIYRSEPTRTLLADSRNLAELARRSDVDVTLEIVPEMQHIFQVLAGAAPEAHAAIAKLARWVRPHLGLGGS
jgi:epsilon-lactone hydrolase